MHMKLVLREPAHAMTRRAGRPGIRWAFKKGWGTYDLYYNPVKREWSGTWDGALDIAPTIEEALSALPDEEKALAFSSSIDDSTPSVRLFFGGKE